jgi:hypothetical protein
MYLDLLACRSHTFFTITMAMTDFFNEQCKHQLENLPDMEMPAQLTQTLFDHQVQGVKWLVQRERGQEPSPFYQQVVEGNKTVWFCNITNAAQDYPVCQKATRVYACYPVQCDLLISLRLMIALYSPVLQ